MCGIAAIISLSGRPVLGGLLERMVNVVQHRGPDGTGIIQRELVHLGHRRLSILDVDSRSSQPFSREGRNLIFNGEIYNYVELASELRAMGETLTTTSDTEVLLLALKHWGEAALQKVRGMFTFVYFDELENKILICRDRFGEKPLIMHRDGDFLYVASEAKQLLAIGVGDRKIDCDTAAKFLFAGSMNQSCRSFFNGFNDLQASHLMRVVPGRMTTETERYYKIEADPSAATASYGEAVERTRDLFLDSMRIRLRADVKLGACLSGGVDSSAIVCTAMALQPSHPLSTITFFSEEAGHDERKYSRAVVAAAGTQSHEIRFDDSQLWEWDALREINYYQDQPILGGSQFNEYHVFKAAKEIGCTVMLDGQGADEYFGGYGQFWFAAQIDALSSMDGPSFLANLSGRAAGQGISRTMAGRRFLAALLRLRKRGVFRLAGLELTPEVVGLSPVKVNATDFTALSLDELTRTSVPWQLHSEDRNSMRWSVESRLPFLDHALVEYVLGLPASYKVGDGWQKRVLRDAVPSLPSAVARRRDKVGFASPDLAGMRKSSNEIRDRIRREMIELPFDLDRRHILTYFDAMVRGDVPYDEFFFRVHSFGAWREQFSTSWA